MTTQNRTKVTELELEILLGVLYSDYQDNHIIVDHQVWWLDANDVDMKPKQIAGAVASCSKKGYATTYTEGAQKEHTIALTALGAKIVLTHIFNAAINKPKPNIPEILNKHVDRYPLFKKFFERLVKEHNSFEHQLYKRLLNNNIVLEDNAISILAKNVEALLKSSKLKLEDFENALFKDTEDNFAFFSKQPSKLLPGIIEWSKYRISKRFKRGLHYVNIDISNCTTYSNHKIATAEAYVKTDRHTTVHQLLDLITTGEINSMTAPFYHNNKTTTK